MSRILIKNLPKQITESKIREIFEQKGHVTDVQLKYTPEGKFRQFAFVGYHDEAEAAEAIKFYDNTYVSTSKIKVECCTQLGDVNKPKAWSKYSSDKVTKDERPKNETNKRKKKVKGADDEILQKFKNDPQFEEFMELHNTNVDALSNAKIEEEEQSSSKEEDEDEAGEKLAHQKISDVEYMKSLVKKKSNEDDVSKSDDIKLPGTNCNKTVEKLQLFTIKLRDLPYNCKKKNIKDFLRPVVPFSIRIPRNIKGIAYVGFKTEKKFKQALLKDRSLIDGKRISVMEFKQKATPEDEAINPIKMKWKSQEESLKHEEDIGESGKIFVRNLTYTTTEDDVSNLFSKYGPLAEVNLPIDFNTRKPKGFGVVTFLMPEHAVKAYTELDGSILHGRMVHLLPGKSSDVLESNREQDTSNYKLKKGLKQKTQAGSSHNWNSLFLGHNAVADLIAKNYGTTKENVLNSQDKSSAAVRLALGETEIVTKTRKYLEGEGVFLDAFNEVNSKRSKTLILIKNLPAETEPSELRELFQKYGIVGRLIFPPSGITALVEFVEPSEARRAFTNLAYSKFKHLPLYLEWAPDNTFTSNKQIEKSSPKKEPEPIKDEKIVENTQIEEEEEPEPDTTLFVKNLNFKTTDEGLHKHFECCGRIHYASVATKKDKNSPGNKLSMGYGFVRYFLKSSTDKALKTLQCSTLDGKSLELKRSERTLQNDVTSSRKSHKPTKQNGTKILVRNVPFQANQNEIRELFRTFGEIKALRLPKKMSGEANAHRGFAFIDYHTASDAKQAFEALSQSTHLYGRRLVLEWASTSEDVDTVRKRTADHFHPEEKVKSKKSTLDIANL